MGRPSFPPIGGKKDQGEVSAGRRVLSGIFSLTTEDFSTATSSKSRKEPPIVSNTSADVPPPIVGAVGLLLIAESCSRPSMSLKG
jgi:hypothetical protein